MAEAAVEAGSTEGARAAMQEAAADLMGRLPAEQRDRAGAVVAQLSQALEQPVTRFTLGYDPGAALARIDAPVLALYGDTDGQIDAAAESAAMEGALRGRGTVRTLAGINHFFQEADTGELSEVAASEQTLAPEVLPAILEWVGRTTGSPRPTEGRRPSR